MKSRNEMKGELYRTRFTAFVICGLLAGLSSCGKTDASTEKSANQPDAPAIVPVVKAARADLVNDLVLTAEFEPFQQVDVMAKVAGYVQSIKVDIGDRVREGQILAVLEIPEMEDDLTKAAAVIVQTNDEIVSASDELHRAEQAHELAHLSYTRIAEVLKHEPGLVPQQEVDEARSRDLIAEAQVSAAKSSLRTAEQRTRVAQADQTRIQTLHKYMTISAPFEGVVTKRYANAGSMIQAGTASQTQAMPIVQLSQNNLLRLILPVPESGVSHVHVGEAVDVRVTSLGRAFPGRVARFAEKIQPSTRTMDTEVDVPNPTLTLIPGMYAEVNLRIDERRNVLSIPLDAVDRSGSASRVYTVTPDGTLHITPLTLGLESDQRVEVISGLQEGDTVVVGRHAGLKDGQQVQVRSVEGQVN
jgi:RND family efflux transporter MFP subunit